MWKFLVKLIVVVALAATISILWIFFGRQLSLFVDRYRTIETSSEPVKAIVYDGNGTGGTLVVNDLRLDLTLADPKTPPPHIGTSKENELALSFGGRVFAFGPLRGGENLATDAQSTDNAFIAVKHSVLAWPNFFETNFMTGNSPKWKRNRYYLLTWQKQNGAKLEMLWCYEQFYYRPDGWTDAMMSREGATGLIRVEISDAAR